jgi:hypothetical protein
MMGNAPNHGGLLVGAGGAPLCCATDAISAGRFWAGAQAIPLGRAGCPDFLVKVLLLPCVGLAFTRPALLLYVCLFAQLGPSDVSMCLMVPRDSSNPKTTERIPLVGDTFCHQQHRVKVKQMTEWVQ